MPDAILPFVIDLGCFGHADGSPEGWPLHNPAASPGAVDSVAVKAKSINFIFINKPATDGNTLKYLISLIYLSII
jgi:hypothetical protein